jgi:flagellar motor component MotA
MADVLEKCVWVVAAVMLILIAYLMTGGNLQSLFNSVLSFVGR